MKIRARRPKVRARRAQLISRRRVIAWHRDDAGTTLTEMVMMLPIFIVIFAGLVKLGHLSMESVRAWSYGYVETIDELEAHRYVSVSDIINFQDASTSERQGSVLLPTTASESAIRQMQDHPPNIENPTMRLLVEGAEAQVFAHSSGLPFRGHLGEINGRAGIIPPPLETQPVTDAISANPAHYFGSSTRGSSLSWTLLYDSPSLTSFGSLVNCEETGNDVMGYAMQAANGLLTGSGVRPALAAGMQYGTITGEHTETISAGPFSAEIETYFTVGISPHTLSPTWHQPFMTMFISRLAMEDCDLQPYSGLLGIREATQTLPTQVNQIAIDDEVPTPQDVGLAAPFDY